MAALDYQLSDDEAIALSQWAQGDYSLDLTSFAYLGYDKDGELGPFADDDILGCVVVTQTCDIVRATPDKAYVAVCPIVAIPTENMPRVIGGTTPIYATLGLPPIDNAVVDLGRMMTISKQVLARLSRKVGFASETDRSIFARCLERKHGRFAFPDDFSDQTLSKLRDRAKSRHTKDSQQGKAYRAITSIRVEVTPNWSADLRQVRFLFVLDAGAQDIPLKDVHVTLRDDVAKLPLPPGYQFMNPAIEIKTLRSFTAEDWINSHHIDLDFISISKG